LRCVMSAFGTKRTWRSRSTMSAFGLHRFNSGAIPVTIGCCCSH
jgi:hypothetical protein